MMTVVNYSVQDSMGANNFFWNGDAWFRAVLDPTTDIGERFADADGRIRATFDVIWLSGWAPHDSQPKPLKPGSATASLEAAVKRVPK